MGYRWQYDDATGQSRTGPQFDTQSDAEQWLSDCWPDLLDEGVQEVTLFEGANEVYGPMSLHGEPR